MAQNQVEPVKAPAKRRKDLTIETLRGIACILVVAYHVKGAGSGQGLKLPDTDPWARIVNSLVYIRMPLFTFLSGYVYALRPLHSGYGPFIRGKARRLLIPVLFVGTAFCIVQGYAPGINSSIGIPWYEWHIIPVRHFWFLESVFWVFVVVGILELRQILDRVSVIAGIVVVAVALDCVVPVGNNFLGLRMGLYLLPFFLTGVACYRFDWRGAPTNLKAFVVAVTVILAGVTQLGIWGAISEVPTRHSPIAAALGIGACASLLLLRWVSRPFVYIGAFSFVIYMVHPIGAAGTRFVLDRAGIDNVSANMIIGIAGGIVFGIAVELISRRFRILRFLVMGEKYRRKDRSAPAGSAESARHRAAAGRPSDVGPLRPTGPVPNRPVTEATPAPYPQDA